MRIVQLSEGAEAQIYSLTLLGIDAILKRRSEKSYRIKEIDGDIRIKRTRNEARIIGLVSALGVNSPGLLLVDRYDIFMSRIYGTNLNDLINSKADFKLIFLKLGSYIALLHSNNIVHGDFTPANIVIGKNSWVSIIDFGLSQITSSVDEKALDLLLMKRSVDAAKFEMMVFAYMKRYKDGKSILDRLAQIEKRGRYSTRSLLTL